jgi:uncharacterized protein HemX
MMRDYSRRYSPVVGNKQRVVPRKRHVAEEKEGRSLVKAVGWVLSAALILGCASSYWFDRLMESSFAELTLQRQQQASLKELHASLLSQRDQLLDQERMEVAVVPFGLYPPESEQIKVP